MANLRLSRLVLYDKWPGLPSPHAVYPNRTAACGTAGKGWDNTVDNFSVADDTSRYLNRGGPNRGGTRVRIGEKRQAYTDNTNCPGYYTMMYLCLHSFESGAAKGDISKDFSDGRFFCAPAGLVCASSSEWADTSVGPYHVVSNCYTGSDVTKIGMLAIPCSTYIRSDGTLVDSANNGFGDGYGWFWVGGVCPCKDATLLDDETGSTKGVDITCESDKGPVLVEVTGGAAWLLPADITNLTDATSLTGPDTGGLIAGWVCDSAA